MRICFISRRFFPAISGMSVYALNLIRQLHRLGHEVTLLAQYRGDMEDNVYKDGPPIAIPEAVVVGMETVGEQRDGDFEEDIQRLVAKIGELHRKQPFDVLHAQFAYPPGLAALEAGKLLRLPVVVSVQGGDGHWFGSCCSYHRKVMQVVLQNADRVVVGTRSFAGEIKQKNGIDCTIQVVPGATDISLFAPSSPGVRECLRRDRNLPLEARILLYHGRIDRRKGLAFLLEAFRRTSAVSDLDVRLVLSGVGPDESLVDRLINEWELAERVHRLGYVEYADAWQIYNLADILCVPTFGEGFSNTIVEAMACGLPVVSTDTVGVADVLSETEAGIIVPARNASALAEALAVLVENPERCRYMGMLAREFVARDYDWERVAANYTGIYREVRADFCQRGWHIAVPVQACRFRRNPQIL